MNVHKFGKCNNHETIVALKNQLSDIQKILNDSERNHRALVTLRSVIEKQNDEMIKDYKWFKGKTRDLEKQIYSLKND